MINVLTHNGCRAFGAATIMWELEAVVALKEQIENILSKLTDDQRELFARNINLWEKTAELNGRPQHFDSFEVDTHKLMQEWYFILEDMNTIEFDSEISQTASEADYGDSIQQKPNFSITPKLRFEILERDGFRCQLCGATAQHRSRLEVDHKVPKKQGGSNEPDNLWTLCFSCNRGKGTKII